MKKGSTREIEVFKDGESLSSSNGLNLNGSKEVSDKQKYSSMADSNANMLNIQSPDSSSESKGSSMATSIMIRQSDADLIGFGFEESKQ